MSEWPAASALARPDGTAETTGRLQIVGIGPGLPEHLTAAGREAIRTADAVYAAPLYQEFLAQERLLEEPTVIDSRRADRRAQVAETLRRVAAGERVVHVSGGDPAVYGKSDLLVRLAERRGETSVPIEVIPGVTAALGAAATLGAPLSRDFATVSLSSKRDWPAVEHALEQATKGEFVLALYNVRAALSDALAVIARHRETDVPVALLEDVGRGDRGRAPNGEGVIVRSLEAARETLTAETPGTIAIVGTEETAVLRPAGGGRPFLVTPRDGSTDSFAEEDE